MSEFDRLVMKIQEAASGGMGHLSTGEALAAALALNRGDWLTKMGYTIPQALERVGVEWSAMIPAAAAVVNSACAALSEAAKSAADETVLMAVANSDSEIGVNASLVTYGFSPGYRDVSFTIDVERYRSTVKHRMCVNFGAQDSERMVQHILEVHQEAWRGSEPIDVKPGEQRPRWID